MLSSLHNLQSIPDRGHKPWSLIRNDELRHDMNHTPIAEMNEANSEQGSIKLSSPGRNWRAFSELSIARDSLFGQHDPRIKVHLESALGSYRSDLSRKAFRLSRLPARDISEPFSSNEGSWEANGNRALAPILDDLGSSKVGSSGI